MKSLPLWSLALVLAVGNLLGCSGISRKSSNALGGNLAGPGITESRQPKPSPCIKRDNASARSIKRLRKTKDASVGRDQQKNLQAKAENQTHI
jgi:hypothetical protein